MVKMTRRTFTASCVAGALSAVPAFGQSKSSVVTFPHGGTAPSVGMGSWRLGQGRKPASEEEAALKEGLSLGMNLIDTAEMYGNGTSEELVSSAISGRRESVFVVSKVLPYNATPDGIRKACAASLARLKTDYLDLYLLHWRGSVSDLHPVVEEFEALKASGQIRRWGVSNFGVPDMEELFETPNGRNCATNQVLYNLEARQIERGLIPWSQRNQMPLMAYSPLGSGGGLLKNPALAEVAARRKVSPAAVAIAWTIRGGQMISIPESGSVQHIRENAVAASLALSGDDLATLDAAFPA